MLPLEEVDLERQDGEELVHVALDVLDAILLPRPYLGGDVVVDGDARAGMDVFRDAEVEAGVVHQNQGVGLPLHNVALAEGHVGKDGAQVEQDGNEAHVGQVAIMLHRRVAAHGSHQVAPKEAELRLRVFATQGRHQVRRMEVARGFAYNQVIFHKMKNEERRMKNEAQLPLHSYAKILEPSLQLVNHAIGRDIDRSRRNGHITVGQRPVVGILLVGIFVHE